MGCPDRTASPCYGGDGSACSGPDLVNPCHAEFVCSEGIAVVPDVALSFGATEYSILWTGVNVGDTLEAMIKSVDSNTLIYLDQFADVASALLGETVVGTNPAVGDYVLAVRRLVDGQASAWSTYRGYFSGTGYDTILDGAEFIVDGASEDQIVD